LDPDGFRQWQAGQMRSKSPKTLNEYRNTLRSLCNWMLRNRRITENPFKLLPGLTVAGKERYVRRALSQAETARLLAASGERWLAYLTAVRTGLRRTELDTLAWGDLSLDTEDTTVAVRAENAKNRRRQSLPLRPEVAEALKKIRPADWTKNDLVFPCGVPNMDMFKKDLAAARIAYEDDEGRVVDFHSLRKTLCTDLCRSEVSPWKAMRLMRHSDIKLTVKDYSDEKQMELREALGKLPALGARGAAVSPPAAPAITQ
jgi:integrase